MLPVKKVERSLNRRESLLKENKQIDWSEN
jgi:hypothetical protein